MKALLLIALLVWCSHAAIIQWQGNANMYNDPEWVATSWEASQKTVYDAASSSAKGAYLFASTWAACKTPMTDFGYDNANAVVSDLALDAAFNNELGVGGTPCQAIATFADPADVYPFSPVSFQLVKCWKNMDKKYPTKTTSMTEWFTCMKASLLAVDMDVTKDFFFSEKLSLHADFKVMDSYAESDWTYASLGGFSHCVERKCSVKFYDEDTTNAGAGIFTTAWGRAYHIDIGTKIDAECSKTKVGATPKAGDAIDLKGYNDCFKALIPHMVGQDRKRIMCFSMCANPPGLFKGPYGPSPVVNSAVDGEIYTSTSDGEFIREKAKILNDLVTCAGKVSTFDFVGPMQAKLEDQTNYFTAGAAKYTDADIGTSDSAWIELNAEGSTNDEMRFCFYQNQKCRQFWNFVHHDYQSTLFFSKNFKECIDACNGYTLNHNGGTLGEVSEAKRFNGKKYGQISSVEMARDEYLKCNNLASIAWYDMISKRNEHVGATILTAAALIAAVLTFVF